MAHEQDVENGNNSAVTEIREPLIPHSKVRLNEQDGSGSDNGAEKGNKDSLWMVYLSTFVVVWGSYEFGCCAGYSSPTQAAIRGDVNLSLGQYSLFGSILTIGAMIGAITSGPIADLVGRKGALRTSVTLCTLGWLSIYFAKGALALDIGRLATGYGMGVFSYVVPVFIAEIAPKDLRGGLTTLNQLMICTGVSVSFIIGTMLKWRTLALSGLIPCLILFVGLFIIPESPRWLAKIGRHKEFEAALQKLRGKEADISSEAAEIQDYIETLEHLPKARMLDLFQRRYLRSVSIGVGLMVCQQFGGINGVCFYTSQIFASAGFPSDIGTITYAIIQLPITALGAALIDKAGRRVLLLTSGTGLVLGCFITALAFYFQSHELSQGAVPALAGTGILVYIASFSIGMGSVPWVVMSEVFPINIKGAAGSLATLVNWFGSWVCSFSFNYLMSWSTYGTFIIFGVANALAILFIAIFVPETKGRTLEEIQAAINKS